MHHLICTLQTLPDAGDVARDGRGFALLGERIFLLRCGRTVVAYRNRCPHRGTPLDWMPDRFLDAEGQHIICATHGAVFRQEDGLCLAGPCAGLHLASLDVELRDRDEVWVALSPRREPLPDTP